MFGTGSSLGEDLKSQQTVAPGTLRLTKHSCRDPEEGRAERPCSENAELEVPTGLVCVAAAGN